MRLKATIILFTFAILSCFAQDDVLLERIKKEDLSAVIYPEKFYDDTFEDSYERPEILGYIGNNYQRFQIHFTSFYKDKNNGLLYHLSGKTKVKGNICNFKGTLLIVSAGYDRDPEMSNIENYKAIDIISRIELSEDKSQSGSGKIVGTLSTDLLLKDDGKLIYDGYRFIADGYRNNQFEGTWTSYRSGMVKKCNWGDFRIPDSPGLDIGAGYFSISSRFRENGWQSYNYACNGDPDTPENRAAREKEFEKWWE